MITLFTFLLISCDDPITRGRQMYKSYFKKTLKDPDSFKVYSEKYIDDKEGTVNGNWIMELKIH